jgi:hypothetical protein
MARDIQPDNIFLRLTNASTLQGNNDLEYYYREGRIWATGTENLFEPKFVNLDPSTRSKTTLIKAKTDPIINGGIFITPEGESIPHNSDDEIYASSNYFGSQNISRDYNSQQFANSWWYDTQAHRAYKIYVVLSYTEVSTINSQLYYNWEVSNAYIVYKDASQDPNDGIYTFSAQPVVDVSVTASATFESPNGLDTWGKASLNMYLNNTIYTSSYVLSPTTKSGSIEMKTTFDSSNIQINDTVKLSVSVDDDSTAYDHLIVTEYSMSFSTPGEAIDTESYLGLTTGLDLENNPDCQPVLNNVISSRQSLFIEDVDYSNSSNLSGSGILLPQNIELLRQNSAEKAATPDSNYSQTSHTGIRYIGTKTTRKEVNQYQEGEPTNNLGSIPNVESLNAYLGYFSKVVDPYPNLNNKTALFVKYLIDASSTLYDPSLSDINFNNLENTFKLKDSNSTPTNVIVSIQNIDEAKELKKLESVTPSVYSVGTYPNPILFSQNSSTTNSNTIPLLGTTNITSISPWWSVNVSNRKELRCVSSDLINTYDSNYYMGDLPYNPGENTDFPSGVEPSFTKFDPVTSPWSLVSQSLSTPGDEFRFENNEDYSYKVVNVNYTSSVSLTVTLDKEVDASVNPNFFLIRRLAYNPGFVILNEQKPYGFPVSASSSPGIVTPQYRVDALRKNPDDIITSLIEKNLI